MPGLHGTVGLGPIGTGNGPSFIEKMADLKLIEKKIISISINYHNATSQNQSLSYVTFGQVDPDEYQGNMYNHASVKNGEMNSWWTVSLDDLKYNGKSIFTSAVNYAIFDSGTSFIYLPKTDWDAFNSSISQVEGLNCSTHVKHGVDQYCKSKTKTCEQLKDDLGSLKFKLQSVTYTIPPKGFLLDNILGAKCVVGVSYISDSNNMVILGDTFMRNFYVSLEYENYRIGLAINKNAPWSNIEINLKFGFWYIFAIICLILLLIGLLACIIYCCLLERRKKRKERRMYKLQGGQSA